VVALSNTSGAIVERYEYSAYGQTQIMSAGYELRETSDYSNPYMFTGRRLDDETGLYYYRARYYKPDISRFLQPDPIGYDDGLNMYTYVGNNPLAWTDPLGLCKGGFSKLDRFKIAFWNNVASGADWLHYRLGGTVKEDLQYLHFEYRKTLNIEPRMQPNPDVDKSWILLPYKQSVFHQYGDGTVNKKYVNIDGRETILSELGSRVTRPDIKGSYNFGSKPESWEHVVYDILPWIIWGNDRKDPTTSGQRLKQTTQGIIGLGD